MRNGTKDDVKISGLSPADVVAMLGLRPISGGAPDDKAKKLAGKYETPEALEKAYQELEAKLGEQGKQLGEAMKLVEQYKPWVEKAIPVVDWYSKNVEKVNAWVASGMQVGAAPPANGNGQPSNGAVAAADAQARAAAAGTAGYEWLTPQEKAALVGDIRNAILTETLKPWTESFTQQAQAFANTLQQQTQNQHKSFTDVLWRTFERVLPKEKLDEVKAWHEASLRFADPSKIDPMKIGDEFVSMTAENASLKARIADFEKKQQDTEKASVPALFGSLSPDTAAPNDTAAPESREDRFKAVMHDVQTQHGPEGVRSMFP